MQPVGGLRMARGKKKLDAAYLEELIAEADKRSIDVRTEKLLREVGYHARSGRCRLKGKDLIIIDRDAPTRDQIDFLADELEVQDPIPRELHLSEKKAGKRSPSSS